MNLQIGEHVERILNAKPVFSSLSFAIPDANLIGLIQTSFEQLDGGHPLAPPDDVRNLKHDLWEDGDWLQLLDMIREWDAESRDQKMAQLEDDEISDLGIGILWASMLIREYQKRVGGRFMS